MPRFSLMEIDLTAGERGGGVSSRMSDQLSLLVRFRRALLLLAEKGEAAFESCIAFLLDCAFVAFLIGWGGGL